MGEAGKQENRKIIEAKATQKGLLSANSPVFFLIASIPAFPSS